MRLAEEPQYLPCWFLLASGGKKPQLQTHTLSAMVQQEVPEQILQQEQQFQALAEGGQF
jgi:hypothetical protein